MHLNDPALVHILDELGYVAGGGLGQDLLGRADLDDGTVLHDAHSVADAKRLVEVVGDEQDRLAKLCLDLHHLVLHLASDQRIQRAERLVHQQDGWV